MQRLQTLKSVSTKTYRSQSALVNFLRAFSSQSSSSSEESDFKAAREWHSNFRSSTLPIKIATTTFSMSSGAGGQKVNKTASKATTVWPLNTLLPHLPKALHQDVRTCRYYVASSDSISIQCDVHRNQSSNREETHKRLFEELKKMYNKRVPGITPPEQKKRIEALKKAENAARLKTKKIHSSKKQSRGKGNDWN